MRKVANHSLLCVTGSITESDNDPLVSADLRTQLKNSYAAAQVHTFHHKGHFPYLNAAGEYNAVLRKFLTQ